MGCVIIIVAVLAVLVYTPLIFVGIAALVGYGIGYAVGASTGKENAVVGGAIGGLILGGLAVVFLACKIFGAIGFIPGLILIAIIVLIIYNM